MSIGKSLGRLTAKVDALKKQRQAVADELRAAIAAAEGMMAEIGEGAAAAGRRALASSAKTAPSGQRKRRRKLSPEGRAAIIAAVKRRWAAQKKAQG
jgi:hypothetical protein